MWCTEAEHNPAGPKVGTRRTGVLNMGDLEMYSMPAVVTCLTDLQ